MLGDDECEVEREKYSRRIDPKDELEQLSDLCDSETMDDEDIPLEEEDEDDLGLPV